RNVLGLAGLVTFFALWQVSSNLGVIDDLFFSSPAGVYLAAVREAQLPRFWRDVQYSLTEVSVGFLASFVLAVPLGLLIGWYRRVSFAFDPWLNFLNAIPRPALIPLVVLWVGLGIEMKTIIVFLGGFFSIILPTVEGVRTVDQQLLDVAHSFRASQRRLFTSVVIPATVPFIAAGGRLALGRLLIGVVVAAMDLDVADREFVSLLGPSGCGKSTFLKIVNGLLKATAGEIRLRRNGRGREDAMVFQDAALFPWYSVLDNVAYGLVCAGVKN